MEGGPPVRGVAPGSVLFMVVLLVVAWAVSEPAAAAEVLPALLLAGVPVALYLLWRLVRAVEQLIGDRVPAAEDRRVAGPGDAGSTHRR